MYKFAVFDLDGTLANTLEDLANAVNYALEKNGYEKYPVDTYKQMVGSGVVNLIKRAIKSDNEEMVKTVKADFDKFYSTHIIDTTCAYPGGYDMLVNLQKNGVILAVLSNKPHSFVSTILDRLYPEIEFKASWGKKEEYAIKPSPQSLNALLDEIGADKSNTVYIGDSDVDVYTAKNGEVDFIGCAWGFRGEKEMIQAGADASRIVYTNKELQQFIIGGKP
ncbi:MAG: HAD family hydrolase [Acutalibacteraceae bacterium]|nr:HAD family hydrolase [Acutalibacteraceae bacterium]